MAIVTRANTECECVVGWVGVKLTCRNTAAYRELAPASYHCIIYSMLVTFSALYICSSIAVCCGSHTNLVKI